MHNNFRWIALVAALVMVFALSACSGGLVGADGRAAQRTVAVSGSGRVTLTPDVAYVFIGVHSQAEAVADALSENNKKAQSIIETLTGLNIDAKDIQTSSFNIYPQQQFDNEGKPTKMIYMVDNTVNVTVHDLTILGKLLDSTVRSGANSINGISFDVLDKSKAISEARKLAIDDARKQAEDMATAAGVKLGELVSLNASTINSPSPMYDAKGGAMAVSQVPVSAGQLVITVDVSMVYIIK